MVIYQLLLKPASHHANRTWEVFLTIWNRSMQVEVARKVQRRRMLIVKVLFLEVVENIVKQKRVKVEARNENLTPDHSM